MMNFRSRTWFFISLALFALGALLWHYGNLHQARIEEERNQRKTKPTEQHTKPFTLLSTQGTASNPPPGASVSPSNPGEAAAGQNDKEEKKAAAASGAGDVEFPYRLSNTDLPYSRLARSGRAILLQNALIDTAHPRELNIPAHLKAGADPGSYLVQARGPIHAGFKAFLEETGATVVSYIPNDTYLVRAPAETARQLQGSPEIQALLPFEPYFKLHKKLLPSAVEQKPSDYTHLQVLLFPNETVSTATQLEDLGAGILAEGNTSFGPTLLVDAGSASISSIASLQGVQAVQPQFRRRVLNDLTRVRIGVSTNTTDEENYLNLTGTNVTINLNDSGVDGSHPDLQGRIITNSASATTDPVGHGTHVAGTIASSGKSSESAAAVGSVADANFRGMAPEVSLFALPVDLQTGPRISDEWLQQTAAKQTNVFISNNSWGYVDAFEYDLAAASFDAATRDALPDEPGSQPLLFVFAAGNDGSGNPDGTGGVPGSISSPATAKNVITVGSLENLREITNNVVVTNTEVINGVLTNIAETNQSFLIDTDTADQVAEFSSRGNVGIGIEGLFGRFKPDLVAPGTFIVSTRATNWTSPQAFVDTSVNVREDQIIGSGSFITNSIFVPDNGASVEIRTLVPGVNPSTLPKIHPIFAALGSPPALDTPMGTNEVRIDAQSVPPLQPGNWIYVIGNTSADPVRIDVQTILTTTNTMGTYFDELEMLNSQLAPHYRYESGTSMSAGAVSGLLGLMQEFFEEELQRPYSPALFKALLINGARSANPDYSLQVTNQVNWQGWGLVNLANTIRDTMTTDPEETWPIRFVDQSPTNALATGESRSWDLSIPAATNRAAPLRLTLVWTDPPANPNAGIKLVNDLDLVVSNTATHEVFYGNSFAQNSDFTSGINLTNQEPTDDIINNVENVYLENPIGSNYVVSVVGKRVNVNATTKPEEGIRQDFALVVSIGNLASGAFNFSPRGPIPPEGFKLESTRIVGLTNGLPLLQERIGAHPPSLANTNGMTNQWNFYIYTNNITSTSIGTNTNNVSSPPTNVAFITFLPPNLAHPRIEEADIDLYVSTDPSLTNLNEAAIANASKSTRRGGTESIVFTNAEPNAIYYLGVKSEDQEGAEFGVIGLASNDPFADRDEFGNWNVRFFPVPAVLEDGSPANPSQRILVSPGPLEPVVVRRAVFTTVLEHELYGDLLGSLRHNNINVVLFNHTDNRLFPEQTTFVYDDSGQGDIIGAGNSLLSIPTDGPGSLNNFIGEEGLGPWFYTIVDNANSHTGVVHDARLRIEPSLLGRDSIITNTAPPNTFFYDVVNVPVEATNLIVNLAPDQGPLHLFLRKNQLPTTTEFDKQAIIQPPGGTLSLSINDSPPLSAGRWFIAVFNPNAIPVDFRLSKELQLDLAPQSSVSLISSDSVTLEDDSISRSTITVDQDRRVAEVNLGVRIFHPLVSDLKLSLVNPEGSRLLLSENRGRDSTLGYGAGFGTNITYAQFSDNTNNAFLPIKFAEAPFTNQVSMTLSNKAVLRNGFEGATTGIKAPGDPLDGWSVDQGDVEVISQSGRLFSGAAHSGSKILDLNGSVAGTISTNLPTEAGKDYELSFAYTRHILAAADISAEVRLNGVTVMTVSSSITNSFRDWTWSTTSHVFRASGPTTLEIESLTGGSSGMVVDTFTAFERRSSTHYLPEETSDPFIDGPSLGNWTLEIEDTREGNTFPFTALVSWKLDFVFANTNSIAIPLTNGISHFSTVEGSEIKYFFVDTPLGPEFATNSLFGTPGTLELLADRDGLPTGGPSDDYLPLVNNSRITQLIMSTNDPVAPLIPGQRYYLGVRNVDPGTTNRFSIRVDFDQILSGILGVGLLEDGVPTNNTVQASAVFDYYQFVVPTNAENASFVLTPSNGNADLYLRKDPGGINRLPTLSTYDYRSTSPGNSTDRIQVTTNSFPVPLSPGDWFVGVHNADTNAVDYSLVASTSTNVGPNVILLEDGVPQSFTLSPGQGLNTVYQFDVPAGTPSALFELYDLNGDADLVADLGAFPTATAPFSSTFSGTEPEQIVVRTNVLGSSIEGQWFLSAINQEGADVDFTIRATTPRNGILISGRPLDFIQPPVFTPTGVELTWNSVEGEKYEISSSTDLIKWTVETTATAGAGSTTTVTIPDGAGDQMMFFRIRQVP